MIFAWYLKDVMVFRGIIFLFLKRHNYEIWFLEFSLKDLYNLMFKFFLQIT